ncbi:hypothetical protein HN51_036133 [Arachis hypogaea]|uniref:DUF1677 family protein n=1 Tax=Arachis hypogaea TaxID=3818 RepID=A0A445A1I5_ARAHY|nr:uncharacterized protein LOC107633093 [Arachis ipaensis]XP_025641132.1 uncharacterized protein LOC112735921 [Arachis hypogaea]QHO01429.1 uncharacterized protein DS421_13g414990 [Arachis hypogaea]RYR20248.1 hypothetical protein Ahy_B03g065340 [Arachis hypogaea]
MAITPSSSESHTPTPKTILQPPSQPSLPPPQTPAENTECVKCDSCGFSEDCTPAYITRLRHRYQGRWLCGLCIEAVKEESMRSERDISTEEALNRHMKVCTQFRTLLSVPSLHETEHPISALGRVILRRMDSSPRRHLRSNSVGSLHPVNAVGPSSSLLRTGSCFPSLSR